MLHKTFIQIAEFNWLPGGKKGHFFGKNIKKSSSEKPLGG